MSTSAELVSIHAVSPLLTCHALSIFTARSTIGAAAAGTVAGAVAGALTSAANSGVARQSIKQPAKHEANKARGVLRDARNARSMEVPSHRDGLNRSVRSVLPLAR